MIFKKKPADMPPPPGKQENAFGHHPAGMPPPPDKREEKRRHPRRKGRVSLLTRILAVIGLIAIVVLIMRYLIVPVLVGLNGVM